MEKRKRERSFLVRLTKEEMKKLDYLAMKSHQPREKYVRYLIDGVVPNNSPPPDFFLMINELRAIGNNINQIAKKANAFGDINAVEFEVAKQELDEAILRIERELLLPKKRGDE